MEKVELAKDRVEALKAGHVVLAEIQLRSASGRKGVHRTNPLCKRVRQHHLGQTGGRKMKETFIGGRGFDLWLLWNAVIRATPSGTARRTRL